MYGSNDGNNSNTTEVCILAGALYVEQTWCNVKQQLYKFVRSLTAESL